MVSPDVLAPTPRAGRGESGFSGASEKAWRETLSGFRNTSGGVVILRLVEQRGSKVFRASRRVLWPTRLPRCAAEKIWSHPCRRPVEIVGSSKDRLVVGGHGARTAARLKPCFVKSRAMHDGSYVRVGMVIGG